VRSREIACSRLQTSILVAAETPGVIVTISHPPRFLRRPRDAG
jgi:hypothetical protein